MQLNLAVLGPYLEGQRAELFSAQSPEGQVGVEGCIGKVTRIEYSRLGPPFSPVGSAGVRSEAPDIPGSPRGGLAPTHEVGHETRRGGADPAVTEPAPRGGALGDAGGVVDACRGRGTRAGVGGRGRVCWFSGMLPAHRSRSRPTRGSAWPSPPWLPSRRPPS